MERGLSTIALQLYNYQYKCRYTGCKADQNAVVAHSFKKWTSHRFNVHNIPWFDSDVVFQVSIERAEVNEENFLISKYADILRLTIIVYPFCQGKHFDEMHVFINQRNDLATRRAQ